MPYKVIKENTEQTEPIAKTRMQVNKELKNLAPGQNVVGYVGEPPKEKTPDVALTYTPEELEEKVKLQNFLKRYVLPPALGSKFSVKQCEQRFLRKVEKQSLTELRRFWSETVPEDELSKEEQAELQARWEELSP